MQLISLLFSSIPIRQDTQKRVHSVRLTDSLKDSLSESLRNECALYGMRFL